jgi:dipeptidyl aminopeptidase/acylaminoacyl peptidase
MRFGFLLLCLGVGYYGFSQEKKEPIQVSDLLRIKQPGNILLSADGATAYFSLTSVEPEGDKKWEYQFQTQLWAVATDGLSTPRQLTASKESATQMALSPNNRQLAFIRSVDTKPQLFLLNLNGGEAIQLTHSKYGVSSPKWSPDASQLVFLTNIPWKDLANDSTLNAAHHLPSWPTEKPGLTGNGFLLNSTANAEPDGTLAEARAWLQLNEKDKKAKVINRLQFQEESTTNGDLTISQVWLISATPGAAAKQLTGSFNSYTNPQFISNTKIVVNGEADESIHPDRNQAQGIYTIKTDDAAVEPLLIKKDYNYSITAVSPSGKWLAVLHHPVSDLSIPMLAILPEGGTIKDLIGIPADRDKIVVSFKNDELLYATTPTNGGSILRK